MSPHPPSKANPRHLPKMSTDRLRLTLAINLRRARFMRNAGNHAERAWSIREALVIRQQLRAA